MPQKLIDILIGSTEWYSFETKRAAVQPRKLLETLCAFLNSEGGILVVGLEDHGKAKGKDRIFGISENEDNVSEFLKLWRNEFEPPVERFVSYYEEPVTNKTGKEDKLIIIKVSKSNDIHSLKNGDTFARRGSQNCKIGSSEILRLRYERGSIKFEDELSSIESVDDLDRDLLETYKLDTNSKSQDVWQFLKDNGLAKFVDSGNGQLTKACVLLFGKNPSVLLSGKYSIKISHYYGLKANFSGEPNFVRRPFTIEGPLIKQIEQAVNYFRDVVKTSPPKLSGSTFKPSLMIPEWVFQEAITNAVVHRNYNVQNDIQVRFFDDRVEIESPGTYPGHITIKNIRNERFARNPIIIRTLNRFQSSPNLDIGEGVDRMFELMKKQNLYQPIFFPPESFPNSVMLTLPNLNKISYWDTISNYLDQNTEITNEKAREITGIQDTLKMSRYLANWTEQGLLEKHGIAKKSSSYAKLGGLTLENLLS